MMSKPMKTLELHNPMIKVLIIRDEQWVAWVVQQCAVVNKVKNKLWSCLAVMLWTTIRFVLNQLCVPVYWGFSIFKKKSRTFNLTVEYSSLQIIFVLPLVSEFEVNVVIVLQDDHLITENFPIKIMRYENNAVWFLEGKDSCKVSPSFRND